MSEVQEELVQSLAKNHLKALKSNMIHSVEVAGDIICVNYCLIAKKKKNYNFRNELSFVMENGSITTTPGKINYICSTEVALVW